MPAGIIFVWFCIDLWISIPVLHNAKSKVYRKVKVFSRCALLSNCCTCNIFLMTCMFNFGLRHEN